MTPNSNDSPADATRASGSDARVTERYPSKLEVSSRLIAAVGDEFRPAKIRDISANGICLVIDRPFDVGTVLTLELLDTKTQSFVAPLQLKVVYTRKHSGGCWLVGGSLSHQITTEEIQSLASKLDNEELLHLLP